MTLPMNFPTTRFRSAAIAGNTWIAILILVIAGSGGWLYYRQDQKADLRRRTMTFIASLETMTEQELDGHVAALRATPEEARRIVPAVLREIRHGGSERVRRGGARLVGAFVSEDAKLARRLFELRASSDEGLAAVVVTAMTRLRPASVAAEHLGQCLDEPLAPAAIDAACDGLLGLGGSGRAALGAHLPRLTAGRRRWMAGLVAARVPAEREAWMRVLEHGGARVGP